VPAEIFVDEVSPQQCVRAHAKGRDKLTGTTFTVRFSVALLATEGGGSTLIVDAALTVAGKLASLGYAVIKKRAEENFVEFNTRLKAEVS
jgi:carbon monoxide dehydrogenase subunit G